MKKIAAFLGAVMMAFSSVSISDINAVSTEMLDLRGNVEGQKSEVDLILYSLEVVKLVNEERAKVGLLELKMLPRLSKAAKMRVKETTENWSHTRSDGRPAHSIMYDLNLDMKAFGENIAYGQNSPKVVVDGWMNSKEHRENILNPDYKYLGVGVTEHNGYLYWTQIFLDTFHEYPESFYTRAFGDVNSDGRMDAVDASLTLKDYASYSSGNGYVLSTSSRAKSDVTGDERMDSVDASVILNIYARNST